MGGKLNLYSVFHINLAFSSIPKSHYPLILDRCYWPLLQLAERLNVPFGIEASAYSLEQLAKTDASFIEALKKSWQQNRIEFVGAGYTQSIFPLIPARVNAENLKIGNDIYKTLLGQVPKTAYVNEQTYSSGLVDLYLDAGYEHLVMEWNNPARFHNYPPETHYRPQKALNPDGSRSLTLIWNDSIAFQKLQRVLHQDLSQDDYMTYLKSHVSASHDRGFAFYGSDAEVIDYHPGHIEADYQASGKSSDQARLEALIKTIQADPKFEWTTPSEFAKKYPPTAEPIRLESPEYPLPCKKQPKYNPTRWAVSGRDDVTLNTRCYQRYYDMVSLEHLTKNPLDPSLWRKLLEKWGSDFRTHTTDEKTELLRKTAASLEEKLGEQFQKLSTYNDASQMALYNPNDTSWKGIVVAEVQFPVGTIAGYPIVKSNSALKAFQVEAVREYQDQSVRWLKACLQVELPANSTTVLEWEAGKQPQSKTEYKLEQTAHDCTIKTDAVTFSILPKRGGAVKALTFNHIDSRPLAGTISHGVFEDITLGADFYSGHFILASKTGQKATDLVSGQVQLPDEGGHYPIRVPVRVGVETSIGKLWKTMYVYQTLPRIDLLYHFRFQDVAASSCRVGILTALPGAFDHGSLSYTTVNGGKHVETFHLKNHHVTHSEPVSVSVSSQHGVGATEGWFAIGDKHKRLVLRTYPHSAYSMPMVHYEDTKPEYFLRIMPSIGEFDDTSHTMRRGHHHVMFTWEGQKSEEALVSLIPPLSLSTHVTLSPV